MVPVDEEYLIGINVEGPEGQTEQGTKFKCQGGLDNADGLSSWKAGQLLWNSTIEGVVGCELELRPKFSQSFPQ